MKKEVFKKSFPVADGVTEILKVKDRELITEIEDISDPVLGIAIRHEHTIDQTGSNYTPRWRTNLEDTLASDELNRYIYTDTTGESYLFTEAFYTVNGDGTRTRTSATSADVSADSTGRLWYGETEVFRELYTDDGHRATTRLADINNSEWFEQRYAEEAEAEEALRSCESLLCNYVVLDEVGDEHYRLSATTLASPDLFEGFLAEEVSWTEGDSDEVHRSPALFLSADEAIHYRSLYGEKTRLEAISERTEDETTLLENVRAQLDAYREKSGETRALLPTYYKQYVSAKVNADTLRDTVPVTFLFADGASRGFNKDGRVVTLQSGTTQQLIIEWKRHTKTGAYHVASISDEKENRMAFRYTADGLLSEIENSQGERVSFIYANGMLTEIRRPYLSDLTIGYTNGRLSEIVSDERDIATITYYSGKTVWVLTRSTKVSKISHGHVTMENADMPLEVEKIRFAYEIGSVIYYDTEHKKEKYIFSASQPGYTSRRTYLDGKYTGGETLSYTSKGQVSAKTHPAPDCIGVSEASFSFIPGDTESYTYNEFNDVVTSVFCHYPAAGQSAGLETKTTVEYTYNAEGKPTLVKTTVEEYYGSATPTKTIVSYESTAYNSAGDPVRVESYTEGKETVLGKDITEIVYNDEGAEVKRITYNTLAPSDKTYTESETDEKGRTLFDLDVTGRHKTEYSYFTDGSLAAEHYPNGGTLAYAYDKEGNTVSVTSSTADGEGNTNVTHYTAGLVTRVESGNHVVDYEYDGKRRLTKVKLDDEDYVTYIYDVDDENYGITDATQVVFADSSEKILLKRDDSDRLTRYFIEGTTMTDITYENDGRIKQMFDNYGARMREYTYDTERRLIGYSDSRNMEETITYDDYGRTSTKTENTRLYDENWSFLEKSVAYTYSYDEVHNRIESVTASGITATPSYDALSRSTGKKISIGTAVKASEEISYLKHGDHTTSLPAVMKFKTAQGEERIKYSYDAMGNIVKIAENGIVCTRYEYDTLGRLTREDNRAFGKTCLWEYDENGNILSRREYAFTVKSTEELTEIEPQSVVEYKYNGDRLISYNGNTQFVYNALGNPTKYCGKNANWTYGRHLCTYNGMGINYDGSNVPSRIANADIAHDHNGNIIADSNLHFLYDHDGVLFGFVVRNTDEKYLYRRDALGNIIAILDNTGSVVVEYKYNAWGLCKIMTSSGEEITDSTHIGRINPFRYRGYYYSEDLGLYYLKSRFYDPEIGRFISPDATSYLAPGTVNGLNLYAYCNNNPVMNVDPDGHWSWRGFWKVVAAVVIVAAVTVAVVATAGAVAVAAGASAATTSAVMAGAAVGGVVAGGLEIGGQIAENGAENIDLVAVAIETTVGSAYGATAGVMSTTTSAGLRLGMRATRVGIDATGTLLHGLNAGDCKTAILSKTLISAGKSLAIQTVFGFLDHRVGKDNSSILSAYKLDGALNFSLKQKSMVVGVLSAKSAWKRRGFWFSILR